MQKVLRLLASLSLPLLATPAAGQEQADLLLHNGIVFTADESLSIHSAVAIRGNRIAAVGGEDLRQRFTADREIDLGGRLVTPGFNDTHIHIRGNPHWYIELSDMRSIAEIQDAIRRKAAELPPGHWITGYGWAEGVLAEGRTPNRRDLDQAAPNHPVALSRAGGHSAAVNSLALQAANIGLDTPDPEGGIIERDEGVPTGILRQRLDVIYRLVPRATPEEVRPDLARNLRPLLSLGVTSIILASLTPQGFADWEAVYSEHRGELPRAAVQIFPGLGRGGASPDEALRRLRDFGRKTGDGDAWLRIGAVKLLVDGGFAGPAAWTLEPYPNQPNYFGIQNIEEEDLYFLSRHAHDDGWQLGYHAIGDAAIQLAVNVFDRVLEESPRPNHRHYLNHFTVLPPEQTMRTMARRNIAIAQQPNFTWSATLESRYLENLEGARLDHNNPIRTPMSYGIFVALGSDNHPIGPMPGLYATVTRRGASGRYYAPDAETLTMADAIVGYTRNGAYLTFEETEKGTIAPGMLADLVVLSDNLLEIAPERILDVQVDLTILDGRIVYDRGDASVTQLSEFDQGL